MGVEDREVRTFNADVRLLHTPLRTYALPNSGEGETARRRRTGSRETGARPHRDSGGRQVSGPGPCSGRKADGGSDGPQLLFVDVSATAVGVAACTVAVVETVVAAVAAVVAAVAVADRSADTVEEADEPVVALAAMQPVRTATAANPPAPVTRRARRAGWGRRLRVGRPATATGAAFVGSVCIEVFLSACSSVVEVMHSSSRSSLGGS
jgi:hypothetical protein